MPPKRARRAPRRHSPSPPALPAPGRPPCRPRSPSASAEAPPARRRRQDNAPAAPFDADRAVADERIAAIRRETDARISLDIANAAAEQTRLDALNAAKIAALQQDNNSPPGRHTNDDTNNDGEHPQEVLALVPLFPGLSLDLVSQIFSNKFKPEHLCKLRHLHGYEDDASQEVTLSGGKLHFKDKRYIKEFGTTTAIWSEGFHNYSSIVVTFWGLTPSSRLHIAMSSFMQKILELAKTYKWQQAVLPLSIDYHTELVRKAKVREPSEWEIPRTYIDRYCDALKVLNVSAPAQTSNSSGSSSSKPKLAPSTDPNNNTVVCKKYNTKEGCRATWCKRSHHCEECEGNHGACDCPKLQKK
jgi:hypothetical protein